MKTLAKIFNGVSGVLEKTGKSAKKLNENQGFSFNLAYILPKMGRGKERIVGIFKSSLENQ